MRPEADLKDLRKFWPRMAFSPVRRKARRRQRLPGRGEADVRMKENGGGDCLRYNPPLNRAGRLIGTRFQQKGMAGMEAYCVKCKEKREIQDPEEVTLKNGRRAVQGKCPVCGTKLFRMLGAADKAVVAKKD